MGKKLNLTGQKFGRLTVEKEVGKKWSFVLWRCQCECGNVVEVDTGSLRSGNTKSCGCYQKERTSQVSKRHGKYHTRLYRIYREIIQRCYNPNCNSYKWYGAKGVKMCEEWRSDFESFYEWSIKNGYRASLSIDRIDSDGDYCPENCKWSNDKEQARNRNNNVLVTISGETKTLIEWSEQSGINYNTLRNRVRKSWPENRLLTPVSRRCDNAL